MNSNRFLLHKPRAVPEDDIAERTTSQQSSAENKRLLDARDARDYEDGPSRKKTKEEKKDRRGANKGRRFGKVRDDLELCWKVACGTMCDFADESVLVPIFVTRKTNNVVDAGSPMISPHISRRKPKTFDSHRIPRCPTSPPLYTLQKMQRNRRLLTLAPNARSSRRQAGVDMGSNAGF